MKVNSLMNIAKLLRKTAWQLQKELDTSLCEAWRSWQDRQSRLRSTTAPNGIVRFATLYRGAGAPTSALADA